MCFKCSFFSVIGVTRKRIENKPRYSCTYFLSISIYTYFIKIWVSYGNKTSGFEGFSKRRTPCAKFSRCVFAEKEKEFPKNFEPKFSFFYVLLERGGLLKKIKSYIVILILKLDFFFLFLNEATFAKSGQTTKKMFFFWRGISWLWWLYHSNNRFLAWIWAGNIRNICVRIWIV